MTHHSLFRRLVSLMLAVLVLTASVGLTVQRRACRISGRSKVDVTVLGRAPLQDCNKQLAPAAAVVKDNCCDTSSHVHKLSAPGLEHAAKVLVPVADFVAWVPESMWPQRPAMGTLLDVCPRWFAADSSPPPLAGRALLAFVCTLTV